MRAVMTDAGYCCWFQLKQEVQESNLGSRLYHKRAVQLGDGMVVSIGFHLHIEPQTPAIRFHLANS